MLALLRKSVVLFAASAAVVVLTGCGGGEEGFTVDVAGNYTVALTNRESSCNFENWVEGTPTEGVRLEVTQNGTELHGTVVDLGAAIFLNLFLGSPEFDGSVHANQLTLTNYGTRSQTQGNCSFTYNATIHGALDGDAISGTISYSPATNENPDCADIECSALQEFSGSRPPP